MFADRKKAGILLADMLERFVNQNPRYDRTRGMVVVGLPRGGVPVALEVARKFGCPLQIIASKKLPFPGQPEFAIGAVSADGVVVLNPEIPQESAWNAYVEQQRQLLLKLTKEIEHNFYERAGLEQASFQDKTVVVVDDGIATGMTALAALETARQRGARYTILATPVMSSDSYRELSAHCDEIVVINVPSEFLAVGQHYLNFDQTTDAEVVSALKESRHFARPAA